MNVFFKEIWNSATIMSWTSYFVKTVSLIILLPLILQQFTSSEVTLWILFGNIAGLHMLFDFGFSNTYSRFISYGVGGTPVGAFSTLKIESGVGKGDKNWDTIGKVVMSMNSVYWKIAILSVLLMGVIGSISIIKPIGVFAEQKLLWLAWASVLFATALLLYGNKYVSYLHGMNKIALLKRWESITAIGSLTTSVLIMLYEGGLVILVLANQIWIIVNVLRNRWLCKSLDQGNFKNNEHSNYNKPLLNVVWSSAWRSGVAVIMTYGLIQATGLIVAQFNHTGEVTSYLLAIRLIQIISTFSQAPFYTRIPILGKLYSEGKQKDQIEIAKKGMLQSYWVFLAGFLFIGNFAEKLLQWIGSETTFVSSYFWSLLGVAYIVERFGAMHIQLFTTSNHVVWHIVTGIFGILYVFSAVVLVPILGLIAIPISLCIAYIGFYGWYSASLSYNLLNLKFWSFERTVFIPALCIMLVNCALVFIYDYPIFK